MRIRIADALFAFVLLLALPSVGLADRFTDSITDQLRRQGYSEIVISRTFLGRYRILASTSKVEREIIVNPGTGEILRDYIKDRDTDTSSGGLFDLFGGNETGETADDGDDGDDGDDDAGGNGPGDGSGDGAGHGGSGGGDGQGGSGGNGGGDSGDGDD